ncbi:RICIN domain-containing protein [Spirilliplanes yamanashiensis]|nr:RICIN domain-containing protein [Spirilliplanes yamanashiensis]MDP9815268.1 hypothetical protein [Spirilliplanes yamanashiensis]
MRATDRGSMPLAMLLTVVGVGISLLLSTTVLQSISTTRTERGRAAALLAARSGLDDALAGIRAAQDADGVGLVDGLPCGPAGVPQLTGSVVGGDVRYEATITYLTQDPTGHDAAWARAAGRPCAALLGAVPRFAYVEATGIAPGGTHRRRLYGTYRFKTAMSGNVSGGDIRGLAGVGLCLDAGPAPMAGTVVRMQPCATDPDGGPVARQTFAYQPNVTLSLVGADLCLDAGWPQAVGNVVTLQACGATTLPRQQWSFNFAASYVGTDDGVTTNDKCFAREQGNAAGTRLVLNDMADSLGLGTYRCNERLKGPHHTWDPAPEVGAAAAVLPVTRQLVNFGKYGRCLDVQLEDPDLPFEVLFPCKQTPDPTVRDWNQQWQLPADGTGPLWSDTPKGPYCLTLPPLQGGVLAADARPCTPAFPGADMTWLVRGADTSTYDEAYRIEGTGPWAGWCLTPVEPIWDGTADKAGIAPCGGDHRQKWNAEPESSAPRFAGIGER